MIRRIVAAVTAGLLVVGGWAGPGRAAATGEVTGVFRSAEGDPIADAFVTAYTTAHRFITLVSTGPDGRYRMPSVPAGQIKLEFDRHNVEQWAHQAADFDSATVFDVADGQTTVVDETQLPTGTVRGTISAPGGGPATGFGVYAYRVDATGFVSADVFDQGHYSLSLPAGQWRIGVDHDASGFQYVPGVTRAEDARVFTVAVGQTVVVDETLLSLGAIEGVIKSNNGRPIVDRRVKVWLDDEVVADQLSADDGGYFFRGLEPGTYLVSYENTDHTETWLPGTLHRDQAEPVIVRPGEVTTANTRDRGSAVVHGTLRTPDGAPVVNTFVHVRSVLGGRHYVDITGVDGTWEVSGVDPEDYRVSFENYASGVEQYAYGTADAAQAHVFPLAADSTTVVDDTFVLGSTLRVTATDKADGGPADRFCVTVGRSTGYCTTGSTVTVAGLKPGPTTIRVSPLSSSDYLPSDPVPVTVAADGITPVTVPLDEGGRVNVRVVDRATGTGQKNWYLALVAPGTGGTIRDFDLGRTNKSGKNTTYAVPAGTYQLFVYAYNVTGLGAQWVGETGGTGDQKQAAKIKVKVGKTTRLPDVLLDPGGNVRGTVRGPDGAPLEDVDVDVNPWPLTNAPAYGSFPDGSYRIYMLGPYQWPLVFSPKNNVPPRQMSGATGNRFQAETLTVAPGVDNVYDITLSAGAKLTGTVTVGPGHPSATGGRITAVNPATGDELAFADFTGRTGTYEMPVIGGGPVLLRWTLTGEESASGELPDRVPVPKSGTKTHDVTID